jgi:hypothetical protein
MPARPVLDTAQVMAVKIDEIEGIEDRVRRSIARRLAGSAERLPQQSEIWPSFFVEHNGLAVDDHGGRTERTGGLFDCGKPMRPVMAATGEDPDARRFDMNSQSIAMPFQLPAPLFATGRMRLQYGPVIIRGRGKPSMS